ncbi:uncharacterized protein BT62DRAFT_1008652 [Guyanagaster necrorhizus]|uniref:Uncharacterized protein n=1 Tax=Guyanagaster necrorhizus TaxID=856835 RepID=A0A9P7VQ31_9AGAR|nr:uncharacterized protein BT62DRAFT_1008652 [Guyanagaster necrorhizus MCA 3950]KAG7443966.1 hypothetical protein BT62DRAFT_1008652 [Guyanagaster necrorhizus MCA 3950]
MHWLTQKSPWGVSTTFLSAADNRKGTYAMVTVDTVDIQPYQRSVLADIDTSPPYPMWSLWCREGVPKKSILKLEAAGMLEDCIEETRSGMMMTIPEWRNRCWKPEGNRLYDLWKRKPLRNFFREHGYNLWLSEYELGIASASLVIVLTKTNFGQVDNIHCPARIIHNHDVLIRLVSIDGDSSGDEHYEALRRLSAGPAAFGEITRSFLS